MKQELVNLLGYAADYNKKEPFPHAVFYNMHHIIPELEKAAESFPPPFSVAWHKYNNHLERKMACNNLHMTDPCYSKIFNYLNGQEFIYFLQELTGIQELIGDPHLNGGGLHKIEPGGKLDIHADYNIHPVFQLKRRLNVLIYLNKGWFHGYGGQLELWDKEMKKKVVSIEPEFGTMVVFNADSTSFHGHPKPLTCPWNKMRKSLAAYYYTAPTGEERHSTLFQKHPDEGNDENMDKLRQMRAKGRIE